MPKLCQVCNARPATIQATVVSNGRRQNINLCEEDYRSLSRSQPTSTPFESLFGNQSGLFGNLFGDGEPATPVNTAQPSPDSPPIATQQGYDITERLSEQAMNMLQQAAQHAAKANRNEVDTEHLLLALMESEVVSTLFEQFKINPKDLTEHIRHNTYPATPLPDDAESRVGVSPRVKDAMLRAIAAAAEFNHSYVGPEHLLIGLAEEGDGIASDLLTKYGLTSQAIRQQVAKVVGSGAEDGQVSSPSNTPNLDKFGRDLTALAKEGKLDPVFGRAQEIETTIEVLARRKKNNPVLIGEPGVGKTAIVEGLAQLINTGEVPESLSGKRLIELNVNSLVAGAKYRGEFEERVKEVLDEIVNHNDELLLFIDEIHTIVGAGTGGGEGGLDIANVFKPAMARGDLNLIGATTLNEYQKHIEKDAALERRFQPLQVDEPSIEHTKLILHGLRDTLEAHHKVTITEEAIDAAVELSDRYVTARFLPDKAIDLIDQAAARVKITSTGRPAQIHEIEAELRQLNREQDYAADRKQFERAADLKNQIDDKTQTLEIAQEEWRLAKASGSSEVRAQHIAEIIAKITGIPVNELTAEEREKLLQLEKRLHERLIGQTEAVEAVSNAVRLARVGLSSASRPVATFLFLGPSGVGKTELTKALAEVMYGNEDAMVRIDMSEYGEKHSVARLIGAPPGYVGYDEGGQLTERVRRKPYSIILLDEIEKAHPEIYNILLQVFDDGRLTDGKGRVIDFTNTTIIATSNLGAELIKKQLTAKKPKSSAELKESLMEVVGRQFRPEFINRLDDIIVFQSLTENEIYEIVALQLQRVVANLAEKGIELKTSYSLRDHIAKSGYKPEYGARELRRLIRSELETEIATAMLNGTIADGDTVSAGYDEKYNRLNLIVSPRDTIDEKSEGRTEKAERSDEELADTAAEAT